jgi:endonuclease/exonuclease/phosphatase family metal-dependent hydrolase
MTVRFASFNVENLFARPRAFNLETWAQGKPILDAYAEFNSLIALADYTPAVKARMIDLLLLLEVYRNDDGVVRRNRTTNPRWAWLRANRGSFDVEREDTGIEIVAHNRSEWIGWVELATEPVSEATVEMTARVIQDVAADVLCVVEAESRPSLTRFNQERLLDPYDHVMLIDGNDTRGIDVGIMTTGQVDILSMKSHVDVADPVAAGQRLFSRDCAQYACRLPSGATVWVLLNHFKSQSGGGGSKRARQAQGVRDIVGGLIATGEPNVVVMGDLNEGPTALGQTPPNLAPLFDPTGPLVDVYSLPAFDSGPRPGSFQSCTVRNRLDYIFVSQALAGLAVNGGLERHGLWGTPTNINPPQHWEIYGDIESSDDAASDHAAIFVDINI